MFVKAVKEYVQYDKKQNVRNTVRMMVLLFTSYTPHAFSSVHISYSIINIFHFKNIIGMEMEWNF